MNLRNPFKRRKRRRSLEKAADTAGDAMDTWDIIVAVGKFLWHLMD